MTGPAVRCYVCGSTRLADDADPRNPTCEACRPAREHVVSMQRDPVSGDSLAVCQCGWRHRRPWGDRALQNQCVRAHWREIVAEAPLLRPP